jgi:SAM-dependent methyltransferase
LPLKSLSALEISPGARPVIDKASVGSYRAVNFPEFDITENTLPESFDIIIAEQVFEHLRYPYKAALNVHRMLRNSGVFLIATPFLIRVHHVPHDYTRWTPDGLQAFLEDCGFTSEVRAWGNRKAVKANFVRWSEYGWKRDISNEAEFPVCVWAYARKRDCDDA